MAGKQDRYAHLPEGGRSEYGGGEVNQRYPSGGSRPLPEIPASTSERARLMRQAGLADYNPDPSSDLTATEITLSGLEYSKMSAAQKEAWDLDQVIARERKARREGIQERTNGYIDELEQYVGEEVAPDARGSSLGSDLKRSIEGDFSG